VPRGVRPGDDVMAGPVLVVLAAGLGRRFGGLKQLGAVGPSGEAVMDYAIHDALVAGFERLVVVVRPDIEAVIRAHLDPRWSESLRVDYAIQEVAPAGEPGGTAPAVLSARPLVGDAPFAVVNADDLYGSETLRLLHDRLAAGGVSHLLVGYRLRATVLVGSGPVRRALCRRRGDGTLDRLDEATIVVRPDGAYLATPAGDSAARPATRTVGPDDLVSMNAWGFRPTLWRALDRAVLAAAAGRELLLPAVVSTMLGQMAVDVLAVGERCFSITWACDLATVRGEVSALITAGRYPDRLGRLR
jgi:MobA-like NTP transferase domain